MNIFISGGAKNGKSIYAQSMAKEMAESREMPLYYVATMRPVDEEDRGRIKRHVAERAGWGFITLEQSENICECLEAVDCEGCFLLDSVTALLSNEMFAADGTVDLEAPERVAGQLTEFAKRTGNTVFVSDFIYSDAAFYDKITEAYRSGLALIDRRLAAVCDNVLEACAGNIIKYKG